MGFLNPALLGLLSLGSVPVIIHLLNRRRYQVVRFAAIEFLLRAQVKTRKRLRMENLLLLLARTLAVLLFALAATRPFLPSAAGTVGLGQDRKHLYILLDNSASMDYRDGMSSLLQRAVGEAHDAVRALRDDDPVTLVLACGEIRREGGGSARLPSGRPRVVLRGTRDHGKVHEVLDRVAPTDERLPPSYSRMDPAASLAEVLAAAEPGDPYRRLLVFSDFQRADWAPADAADAGTGNAPVPAPPGPEAPPRATGAAAIAAQFQRLAQARFSYLLMAPRAQPVEDVGVAAVALADGHVPVEGLPTMLQVTVANHGSATASVDVSLSVDGREQGSRRVTLRARGGRGSSPERERVEFPWTGPAGSHYAEARVTAAGNRLRVNDRRGHAFDVRERLRVLAVDGDPTPPRGRFPETRLLSTALGVSRGVAPVDLEIIDGPAAARASLDPRDVVFLCNVDSLAPETWERLAAFVRRGGGLFVYLGDRVDPTQWNAAVRTTAAGGLLPARLGDRPRVDAAAPVPADLTPSRHPLLADLTDPRYGTTFDPPLVAGWWPLVEPLEPGTEVVWRLRDLARSPLLVERRHGRGRVLLCTTSADMDWVGAHLLYAPFVQEAVSYLASAGAVRRDLVVHEPLVRDVPTGARDLRMAVHGADDEGVTNVDLVAAERDDPAAPGHRIRGVRFADTHGAGRYALSWRQPVMRSGGLGGELESVTEDFAAEIHPLEGDPARLPAEELASIYPDARVVPEGSLENESDNSSAAAQGDLTGLALALGTLMLVAEMFLAALFGGRRR